MQGMTAASLYGAAPSLPQGASSAPFGQRVTDTDVGSWRSLVSPRNPLVIFGVILAVTVGAAGFAGSARVGPVKVAGSAGKS